MVNHTPESDSNADNSKHIRTIRGNAVKILPDRVVKFDYNHQEVTNLQLLNQYSDALIQVGIRIPKIIEEDSTEKTLTLGRLPFGDFPTLRGYFGGDEHDHIEPLRAIDRLRTLCDSLGISANLRQYGDNNDYAHFIDLVNRQKTQLSDLYIDQFLEQVVRLSVQLPSLPRVVAHRDFTPANIKAVADYGCIMLDLATFGVSTFGADEGRWYVHHVLDQERQQDILKTTKQLNPFGAKGDLAFLLMVGMRSAREYKMLEGDSYYGTHLKNNFNDPDDLSRFKNKLENSLLNQLPWVSENLKQF